jgi:hypothetical protein
MDESLYLLGGLLIAIEKFCHCCIATSAVIGLKGVDGDSDFGLGGFEPSRANSSAIA